MNFCQVNYVGVVYMLLKKIKSIYKRHRFKIKFLTPKPSMPFDAVFVIGQNKTGTTSMYHFFSSLGLRHLTINNIVKFKFFNGEYDYLDRLVNSFHSFDDIPWNRLDVIERYMSMDRNFYFILTIRDPDE